MLLFVLHWFGFIYHMLLCKWSLIYCVHVCVFYLSWREMTSPVSLVFSSSFLHRALGTNPRKHVGWLELTWVFSSHDQKNRILNFFFLCIVLCTNHVNPEFCVAHKHMTKTIRRQWKWSFLGEILSKGTTVLTCSSPWVGADSLLTTREAERVYFQLGYRWKSSEYPLQISHSYKASSVLTAMEWVL